MQVSVVAPSVAGRYVLRVTLVQEGVAWLDGDVSRAFGDVELTVKLRPAVVSSGLAAGFSPAREVQGASGKLVGALRSPAIIRSQPSWD